MSGVGTGNCIYFWKSTGLSDEMIHSITTSNHGITPKLNYYVTTTRLEVNGSCLK